MNEFAPESTQYNISTGIEIKGEIDQVKFEETFQTLIQRHESLRTSFELRGGEVVQIVKETVPFRFEFKTSKSEQVESKIETFIRPFDLEKDVLLRVLLLELSAQTYVMIIDIHHIITDGVSIQILTDEFAKIYGDYALEPLALQYKDYSSWQDQLFQSDEIKSQEKYWLNQFEGELPVLNLTNRLPSAICSTL